MSAAKTFTVLIYRIAKGMADTWGWYCARCLHIKKAEGWSLLESKEPPHQLPCDGCKART